MYPPPMACSGTRCDGSTNRSAPSTGAVTGAAAEAAGAATAPAARRAANVVMRGMVCSLRCGERSACTFRARAYRALAVRRHVDVAAIPLAAIGLLNPVIASLAMVFSSLPVVASALQLRRFVAAMKRRSAVASLRQSPSTAPRRAA